MAWHGMVCYGMVWYGMVWYGMVWYGMAWYGMLMYGITIIPFRHSIPFRLLLEPLMHNTLKQIMTKSCVCQTAMGETKSKKSVYGLHVCHMTTIQDYTFVIVLPPNPRHRYI